MARHNHLGAEGEVIATNYLQEKGYRILSNNWRFGKFEIDIIASTDEFIVFVEVKTRASSQWGNPEAAVDDAKIKRMIDAADCYVQEHDVDLPIRFDVISIVKKEDSFEVKHFDDAFLAPLN